ncbi:MAG: hypothetical protein GX477_02340 [Clostridiaceae bacterium]|nr:hypothetical protein [Clostridiaceae bacterium]
MKMTRNRCCSRRKATLLMKAAVHTGCDLAGFVMDVSATAETSIFSAVLLKNIEEMKEFWYLISNYVRNVIYVQGFQTWTRRIAMSDYYMVAVIGAVAVSGIIMLIVFHRLEVLSFRTVASITLASLITALIMPAIYSGLAGSEPDKADATVIIMITVAALIAYVVIVLILSILISVIVPKIKPRNRDRKTSKTGAPGSKSDDGARGKTILEQVGALYFGDSADRSEETQAEAAVGQVEAAAGQVEGVAGQAETTADQAEAAAGQAETTADQAEAAAGQTEAAAGQAKTAEGTAASASDTLEQPVSEADEPYALDSQLDAAMTPDPDTAAVPDESPASAVEADQAPETRDFRDAGTQKPAYAGDNYLEQIYLDYVAHDDENTGLPEEAGEMTGAAAENIEKSVDSAENIDKMGIENKVYDSEIMTLEECIDEAFRLREAGDLEGAILYFMYALDKKPHRELTFWIILDICVMYKSLGQQDLALEILNGYYEAYGDTMDGRLRDEIVRNLTDAGV